MTTEQKQPEFIEPEDAWNRVQSNKSVLLVDVRSDMEYLMIGHSVGAINVAWIDHPNWTANENFVPEIRKLVLGRISGHAANGVSLILICRSGNRSMQAGERLIAEGFENVCAVKGGFEGPLDDQNHRNTVAGWRFAGLPWKQF